MYNAFVEGINRYSKLPKYVIVIFDYSFIQEVESKKEIGDLLMWLIREYMRIIEMRKEKLTKKAVATDGPKLVFVKMLPKSNKLDHMNRFKAKRRLFNKSLEEITSRIKFTACLNVDEIMPSQKPQYSLSTGLLSDVGFKIFWAQLNHLMRKLDLNISDVRITQCTISTTHTESASGNQKSIYQYQIGDVRQCYPNNNSGRTQPNIRARGGTSR